MFLDIFKAQRSYNLKKVIETSKCFSKEDNNISQLSKTVKEPADFETAISNSGFGRFNILLLLAICPGAMATVIEVSVVSFILPSAECDLKLDLVDKGILNAITFCGMITSSVAWGYLADTKGRKKLLVWGFLIDVLCVLWSAMGQNFLQLMIAKFFGGFVMSGPFAVLMSYLSEFHSNKYRERIIMIIGVMFSIASILLPILAMIILPRDWNFDIFNMNFTSWKVYLAICGIPSLMSGILLCVFPESPRFLMSQGRITEALETFQNIYSINSGNPRDTFPIKELINEKSVKENDNKQDVTSVATVEAALQEVQGNPMGDNNEIENQVKQPSTFKALCLKPYLSLSFIVYLMNFFILFGQITMRLWLPQLFASLREYEQISTGTTSMCSILEYSVNKTAVVKGPDDKCIVIITPSSYSNNIIVAGVNLIGFLVAGTLVNYLGHKRIQVICLIIAGTCGIALYWSSTALTTLIITTIYICMATIATMSTIGISVSLFPTSLRTMIVSLSWMFGRSGSILGNILFPIFMSFGCIPPFVMIGSAMFFACLLSASLPNTRKLDFK